MTTGMMKHFAAYGTKMATALFRFGRDESGALFAFSLYIFLPMLIIAGMAVDFMRYESRRAALQSTADRAVLAAASTDRVGMTDADIRAVVLDYFNKAGYDNVIQGVPEVINTGSYKSVGVVAKQDINTVFLGINPGAGQNYNTINKLSANAAATAVEGVADIEVSLVLDISGSMHTSIGVLDANGDPIRRIDAMKTAAKSFVNIVLDPAFKNSISLSLVPYTEQVNIGPALFNRIKTNKYHPYSHCVEFVTSDFNETGISLTRNYDQTQHFQLNPFGFAVGKTDYSNPGLDAPICPKEADERVVAISQDSTELNRRIDTLVPRAGTSTHIGLKWAVALLDPGMRPLIADMSANGIVDPAFSDRPRDFPIQGKATAVQKIVVLMTDGSNSNSYRLTNYSYNQENYDLKRAYWNEYNYPYAYNLRDSYGYRNRFHRYESDPNYVRGSGQYNYVGFWGNNPRYWQKYSYTDADNEMKALCDLAKDKRVIIFAIAVEANTRGQQRMADCASTDSHYFSATGTEMTAVFKTIAEQITELRLSL